ncbi:MAG: DUF937 domain-containing protein [Pseudomonadota bacterium]
MINMFDMLLQAQNGEAVKNLSRQFGLSEQQTQTAMGAMMPAFNEAMRRNAQSVDQMQRFWSEMNQRNLQQFYDNADAMRRDDIWMQGNDVLGGLFGSKDVSRAVAQQASLMSGLGPTVIKQMLPVIAAMMMGGLQRGGGSANPLEALFNQMMGQGGASSTGIPGPFGEMLDSMMGSNQRNTPNPMKDNPMGAFVEGMLNRLKERADEPQDQHAESDNRDDEDSGAEPGNTNPFDASEIIDALFSAGKKTQDANSEAMGRIFEQFMGGGRR